MKIHEDRSHMNIDTRWFEKGYAKEDVHSLRLQSLCTEAEAAANKQFYDSHTREEWEQYIRQASLESSAAMKPVMEAIAQDFVCYQYDENIPVSYGSDRWDLYFWCNPFSGAADASERDFSYFTLTFNERQTLEKRKKVCQQVLDLLCSRFQEHPNLNVAVQYSIWFDHPKIHDAVERAKPRLHGLRCIQDQKEGKLLLQDGALLFKPKYAKKYTRTLSQSQILSLSWERARTACRKRCSTCSANTMNRVMKSGSNWVCKPRTIKRCIALIAAMILPAISTPPDWPASEA